MSKDQANIDEAKHFHDLDIKMARAALTAEFKDPMFRQSARHDLVVALARKRKAIIEDPRLRANAKAELVYDIDAEIKMVQDFQRIALEQPTRLDDEPVGYKRPPKHSQFQPGHPGGPGRPKGSLNLRTLVQQRLSKNNGRIAKSIANRLVTRALRGDLKAMLAIIRMTRHTVEL
jgi:Family of unknown function (DUF5681)